ncbi:hypothetical protein HK102_008482 [Quaeritorhiza haematococci]|nr:hypothetical protein HK102_008482 [Quaeritorhiza haematococci]
MDHLFQLQNTPNDGFALGSSASTSVHPSIHLRPWMSGEVTQICGDREGWGPWSAERAVDFTPCFEETVVVNIPRLFLLVCAIPRLIHLARKPSPSVPVGKLYWAKMSIVTLIATLSLVESLNLTLMSDHPTWYNPISSFFGTAIYLLAAGLHHLEHLRSRLSSTILLLFWLITIVVDAIKIRTLILLDYPNLNTPYFAVYASVVGLSIVAFALENIPKPKNYYLSLDDECLNVCPEVTANIFSRLSFHWMDSLMKLGYKKDLDMDDLWPSLLRAVVKSYGLIFGSAAIFKVMQDIFAFIQPMFLKQLMIFAHSWAPGSTDRQPLYKGFIVAFLMMGTAVCQTIVLHQYFHLCLVTGMRLKSAIVTAIYRKALVLSNTSRQSSTVGEIVNLMSVDAGRISDLTSYLHISWSGPFQICLALYFLYQALGPAIFAGVAVMVLMVPVNGWLAVKSRNLQKMQMNNKDSRAKLMDEVLSGMKVIKLYAWEIPFLKKVQNVREAELSTLKSIGYLSSVQSFVLYSIISDEPLTSTKVFVSLALFNLLQFPLAVFPNVISAIIEASVSFNRLFKFLTAEELDKDAVIHEAPTSVSSAVRVPPTGAAAAGYNPASTATAVDRIVVTDGSFAWSKIAYKDEPEAAVEGAEGQQQQQRNKLALAGVSFTVREGTLFAIIGSVGSGKSSMISALLGEMYRVTGEVRIRGSVAYAPQTPWIMNATLRDNILFGRRFDPKFYEATINACGLKPDLDMLPGGDMTEIGERGINLSGGQKQRINLARAVYSRADIYMFDDPLSAVDAHVGKHIFENVIGPKGLLKNKTRVFVTHAIHFLPETDHIMMMIDGHPGEMGTYDQLIAAQGPTYSLIKEYGKRKQDGESEDQQTGDEEVVVENGDVRHDADAKDANISRRTSAISLKSPSKEHLRAESNDSATAAASNKAAAAEDPSKLIKEEDRAKGSVSWAVYKAYGESCSWINVVGYIILAIIAQALSVGQNVYLADWAAANDAKETTASSAPAAGKDNSDVWMRLTGYGLLGLTFSISIIFQTIFIWVFCGIRSARVLHTKMLENIVRLPQSFFDTTPLGRIMNRFSKDQYTVDEVLPRTFQSYFRTLFVVLSVLAVNTITSPLFFTLALPLGALYMYFQRYYLSTSRELKRLDSTSRSPIYAHFQETLGGVSTIRAYKQEPRFISTNEDRIDFNQRAYYPSISSNRWLAVRLEFIGSLVVFGSALFSVISIVIYGHVSASFVGLSLTYSLTITQTLNWMVRMSCEIESQIIAVERIKEYIEVPQEKPYMIESRRPPPTWPEAGRIEFRSYGTRYREGLDLVLKDITFSAKPREKIGIVGRTGAGKSSLTLGLFRLVEPASGSIIIDGLDISLMGLYDLRSRLTIIPQDPVLFAGTIRDNLDPFGTHDDEELWQALESASLKAHVSGLENKLNATVLQGGENFSVGQRQLICLARALLRKTNILVLDEATAAIDVETDNIIQKTIRREFAKCTIITIAHRINTVLDNDRILVLERGRVVEFDSPAGLLKDKSSRFYSLAKESGQAV